MDLAVLSDRTFLVILPQDVEVLGSTQEIFRFCPYFFLAVPYSKTQLPCMVRIGYSAQPYGCSPGAPRSLTIQFSWDNSYYPRYV